MRLLQSAILLAGICFGKLGHAQLLFKVEGKGKCAEKAEVVIGKEKNYLYHVSLPINGVVEVKVPVGNYEVFAVTKTKCSNRRNFSYQGKTELHKLLLAFDEKVISEKQNGGECLCCGGKSPCGPEIHYFPPFLMPWHHSIFYPWYRNWGNPCPFGNYGCQTQFFPDGNSNVLVRSSIYFEGIAKGLKIRFKDNNVDGLLTTSPAHGVKGWDFKTDGRMVIQKRVRYPYLNYNLRTTGMGMQLTNGFCGERHELLSKMLDGLKKLSFPDRAIEDFKEYWATHFPQGRRYCVLPQNANDLDKSVPLEFSTPTTNTRIVFAVLPATTVPEESALDPLFRNYNSENLKAWEPWGIKPAKDKLQAFEWGLAFTFSN